MSGTYAEYEKRSGLKGKGGWMEWAARAVLTLLVAWATWCTVELYDLRLQIAVIQSHYSEDPLPQVTVRLDRIEQDISRLNDKMDRLLIEGR